jgi:hypothetical protein
MYSCIYVVDELAREAWEIRTNSKLSVEEHSICFNLLDGSSHLGSFEWNRNNSQSLVCLTHPLSNSELNGKSFQEVQDLPPIQAAIRFLPNVIIGIILNIATGLLVHRLHANHLVLVTTILSAGSPLLLAIINPQWSWWYCAFWAVLLGPLSADGMSSI